MAANSGCDYYLDYDMSKASGFTFVAYQRTDKKEDAVTSFTVKGTDVNVEKKEGSKSALLDISEYSLPEKSFTLGEWAQMFMYIPDSAVKSTPEYKALLGSKEECTCVSVGNGTPLFAVYLGKADIAESATEAEETTSITEETEEADDAYKADDANATDELLDIEKEEETTTTAEVEGEESEMSISSVFGNGKVISIVIIAVAVVALLIGLKFIMERKKRNEKDN